MTTLQTRAVLEALHRQRHATNQQLHDALSETLPELSLTSLHRITSRLVERGEISIVPTASRTAVLDTRPDPHHHFCCTSCGGIVDIALPPQTVDSIQAQLGTHLADAGLVVRGTCAVCRTDITRPLADEPATHD